MSPKKALRRALAKAGVWVGRPDRLSLDHHVAALARNHRVDCVIDVGANRGGTALGLRDAGYHGPILSFEPVADTFRELEERAAGDRHWRVRNLAIGDAPGTLRLNISESASVSSFLPVTDAYVALHPPGRVTKQQEVEVSTIDREMASEPYERLFLKTDTQGYDLNVLAGASATLDRVVGIQIELSSISIYEGMPDYVEALTVLRDLGFLPTGFYPVAGIANYEFDGVFKRADHVIPGG